MPFSRPLCVGLGLSCRVLPIYVRGKECRHLLLQESVMGVLKILQFKEYVIQWIRSARGGGTCCNYIHAHAQIRIRVSQI